MLLLGSIDPHLLSLILFIIFLTFWWGFYKLTNYVLDKREERKNADHHRS